jgi:hypothetical protein
MQRIVDFDRILADFLKDKRPPPGWRRPAKGADISTERYDEAIRYNIEYWKIENLTKEEREQFSKLVGENCEHYIAKMPVMTAKLFVGTLEINGCSMVIGDFVYFRQSDIDL